MLQLTSREPLSVNVRDFFELECALQSCRETDAASNEHNATDLRSRKFFRQFLNFIIWLRCLVENTLYLVRQLLQRYQHFLQLLIFDASTHTTKVEAQHIENVDRRDESLRGNNTNLWSCLQVENRIRKTRDGAGDHIGNGNYWRTTFAGLTNTDQCIGGLT